MREHQAGHQPTGMHCEPTRVQSVSRDQTSLPYFH
nr:MAG TPA: hypothetical protein [Caudoviricetes sp.]